MIEFKIQQIQPNHADHISGYKRKYIEDMLANERVTAQLKYDGERMLIHLYKGDVWCTSRRISTKTNLYQENQDKLPYLKGMLKNVSNLGYTVIDCECYSKDWSTITGILHSLPERAKQLQDINSVKFACFDCLFFDGVDVRDYPYGTRLFALGALLNNIKSPQIHSVVSLGTESLFTDTYNPELIKNYDDIDKLLNTSVNLGFEGFVLKSLDRKYYDKGASLKCKKFETIDVVICDFVKGNGKYENTVGAIKIGYYDAKLDQLIQISNVNCGTDAEREYINQHQEELKNTVIEVKCQEITSRSLRHPVFIRFRPDKNYKTCTRDSIFE